MMLIDTHTHLYVRDYNNDRDEVVNNAIDNGVNYLLLPNIDSKSIKPLKELCKEYPKNCFPMMGLHPTSVKANYKADLKTVQDELEAENNYIAVGEIGIDLYWDKTFFKEQEEALLFQFELAINHNLPVVIHSRESFPEIFKIIEKFNNPNLNGVFHCFSGTLEDAKHITDLGFKLGIGGVVTFKKAGLDQVVKDIDLKHIVLETDSPYLTPAPYRGKRNQSAYIKYIAEEIAIVKDIDINEVAKITSANAIDIFKLN
ncbi:MAG: TatD family hydrolase [Hyphomicrobiales bacterium]